jgi:phytoene desaturase
MGLFVLYLGVRRQYPGLAHHTILLSARYKELLEEIFEGKAVSEDLSLYLHAPTRTDPSLAPEGCESMYVLAPVPNLRADINWSLEGPRVRDRILDILESTACPKLREAIEVDFFVTPEHFRDQLLTLHGTGFSIQPTLLQSAWFRFHNRSEDVKGLYLVGAGTHPGAGLPGVLCSAKVLEHYLPEILMAPAEMAEREPAATGAGL